MSPAAVAPTPLAADTTFYVATTGSDTNNNCAISASPCLTIQRAWNQLVGNFNLNGHVATIQVADGTYTGGLKMSSMPVGVNSVATAGGRWNPTSVVVQGNCTTPANVVINVTGDAISASGPVGMTLKCVSLQSTLNTVTSDSGATIGINNVRFLGASAGYQMLAQSATILISGNYTIVAGGGFTHATVALGGSIVYPPGRTVTLSGASSWSQSFFQSSTSGSIYMVPPVFTGTAATGVQWTTSMNGTIYTSGSACSSVIPGSVAGSNSLGGQCGG
jgi:hypothetical protein